MRRKKKNEAPHLPSISKNHIPLYSSSSAGTSIDVPNSQKALTKLLPFSVTVDLTMCSSLCSACISQTSKVCRPLTQAQASAADVLSIVFSSIQWHLMPKNLLLCAVHKSVSVTLFFITANSFSMRWTRVFHPTTDSRHSFFFFFE